MPGKTIFILRWGPEVITGPAAGLAPLDARTSAGTVMTTKNSFYQSICGHCGLVYVFTCQMKLINITDEIPWNIVAISVLKAILPYSCL